MSIQIFNTRTDFDNASFIGSIGSVPTMGNLHDGHLSLLEKSLIENNTSVVSIYVNPTQFAPGEDFATYPRTFDQDYEKIKNLASKYPDKEVVIFSPSSKEVIYKENEFESEYDAKDVKSILEGELRPTFFDGVTMVVRRLFSIVRPTNAYFGQKDFQQLFIIKKMVKDLKLPINIIGMPIKREESGLAMSSRNQYLSDEEKARALVVYKTLNKLKELCQIDINQAQKFIKEKINNDNNWNYLTIRNTLNLSSELDDSKVVLLANYKLGSVKLLDNMVVTLNEL